MTPGDVARIHADAKTMAAAAWGRVHEAVASAMADGHTQAEIAEALGVSRSLVHKWSRRARKQ